MRTPKRRAPQPSSFVVYSARDKKVTDFVVEQFIAKYPEYKGKVEVLNMGAQEMLERVRAEKANPQGRRLVGRHPAGAVGRRRPRTCWTGLAAVRSPARWTPRYKDAEGRWFGEILLPEVIMYNNKAITGRTRRRRTGTTCIAAAVERQDHHPGRGRLRHDASIYSAMIQRLSADGSNPQPGYDWLRKLDANTGEYAANPADLYLKMSRQQGVLSAWNLQDILLQANQSNMPFGYVMPASGAPVLVDGVAAVKGGNTAGAKASWSSSSTTRSAPTWPRTTSRSRPWRSPSSRSGWPSSTSSRWTSTGTSSARTRPSGSTTGTPRSRTRARPSRAGPSHLGRGPAHAAGGNIMIDVKLESVSKRFTRCRRRRCRRRRRHHHRRWRVLHPARARAAAERPPPCGWSPGSTSPPRDGSGSATEDVTRHAAEQA